MSVIKTTKPGTLSHDDRTFNRDLASVKWEWLPSFALSLIALWLVPVNAKSHHFILAGLDFIVAIVMFVNSEVIAKRAYAKIYDRIERGVYDD